MTRVTEIIPDLDKLPDWAREAFEAGQYFAVVHEKIIDYEKRLEAAEGPHEAEATLRTVGELVKKLRNGVYYAEGGDEVLINIGDLDKLEESLKDQD